MNTNEQIWDCDDERLERWGDEPERAAMLAYLEVVALWHEQVEAGIYRGIPALHRLPAPAKSGDILEAEPSTLRSRPPRYTPDDSAGHWIVPPEVQERWLVAA